MILRTVLCAIFLALVVGCLSAQSTDKIVLRGKNMAPVSFDHAAHMSLERGCIACHHESKNQKPSVNEFEKCGECHTQPATAPVTTNWTNAFHNVSATKGLCIDCHKDELKAGKQAPVQCKQCHRPV
jgi:nitrate/TMAO reductase-like tetraheme cytochrome c subunit